MLDAITKIQNYTAGLDYRAFAADLKTVDAVVRNLEVIGEAAKHIQPGLVKPFAPAEWLRIGNMRNKLIHDYADTNVSLVWQTIEQRLDTLAAALRRLAADLDAAEMGGGRSSDNSGN